MSVPTRPEPIMARAATENFPVASRLLPARLRAHLLAIYGFARLVDELGDEVAGDRLEALDWLSSELDRAFTDTATHPLLRALAPTIAACELPREPFERLIEANRVDQRVHSYETWGALLEYCHLSADPVGELVLHVFGAASPERIARSNAVCTALQLTEHWQDIREDLGRGRVYVPLEDLARHGCTIEDLAAERVGERLRHVLALEAARTADLFREGDALVASLHGWPRLAVAGYTGGGRAALEALALAGYEVLALSPRPTRRRTIGAIVRLLIRAAGG
ncbi:MAG: squalene synthase HpnC [Acidimicrobiales bacterium]